MLIVDVVDVVSYDFFCATYRAVRKLLYKRSDSIRNVAKKGNTMHCPYCGNKESEVVETRESADMDTIRRRRSCLSCNKRYTTYERIENIALIVTKKDKRREQFDREKLKSGIWKACDKTVISAAEIEKMVTEITRELRGMDGLEVESRLIGEMVAKRLKKLDKVAYIRFASVFKRFVDVEDFEKEVKGLTRQKELSVLSS